MLSRRESERQFGDWRRLRNVHEKIKKNFEAFGIEPRKNFFKRLAVNREKTTHGIFGFHSAKRKRHLCRDAAEHVPTFIPLSHTPPGDVAGTNSNSSVLCYSIMELMKKTRVVLPVRIHHHKHITLRCEESFDDCGR